MENIIENFSPEHKAGFVSIVGRPNVGKSTLMNLLTGENLSIITPKAQTTRHRIMGIINADDYQIVYSDTPGILKPNYLLQKKMMEFVGDALEDADLILWVVDASSEEDESGTIDMLEKVRAQNPDMKLIIVLNKIDLIGHEITVRKMEDLQKVKNEALFALSALHKFNHENILPAILQCMPLHPPFFPKDELTDRSERFFASEMLREKIFLNYEQEIPYSTEVKIESFKEKEDIIVIRAEIYVERDTQKGIIIGKNGEMLKKTGREARESMEAFFGKKVFLETHVRVEPDWRKNENKLDRFGYL
jgi:GTP-binding protein Era